MLRILDYDLELTLPYTYACNYLKCLGLCHISTVTKVALSFLNDIYYTSLPSSSSIPSHVLAISAIYFALNICGQIDNKKYLPGTVRDNVSWFKDFDVTETDLSNIIDTVMLPLYRRKGLRGNH